MFTGVWKPVPEIRYPITFTYTPVMAIFLAGGQCGGVTSQWRGISYRLAHNWDHYQGLGMFGEKAD